MSHPTLPPGLAALAAGRDHISTQEFAQALGISPQTARKNHCVHGTCFGIRPLKPPGALHLLWPVGEIARVLVGEAAR